MKNDMLKKILVYIGIFILGIGGGILLTNLVTTATVNANISRIEGINKQLVERVGKLEAGITDSKKLVNDLRIGNNQLVTEVGGLRTENKDYRNKLDNIGATVRKAIDGLGSSLSRVTGIESIVERLSGFVDQLEAICRAAGI